MLLIERGDLADLEALGDRDHRGIDCSKWKVRIALDKLGHAREISASQLDELEFSIENCPQESRFGVRADPRL